MRTSHGTLKSSSKYQEVLVLRNRKKFPEWLKKELPSSINITKTRELLEDLGLNTVCQSALCPNQSECFAKKTATFMIMGDVCTRDCKFCAVFPGEPEPLDEGEPSRIAEAAKRLKLRHVVVTSVTRDDLPDGGAAHFAEVVYAVRDKKPDAVIEVLTPDFKGDIKALSVVVESKPHIFNHNVETVPSFYKSVRPSADYHQSLKLLRNVKTLDGSIYTKSGLMLGFGESKEEVEEVINDLYEVGCDIITIGQYLQPSENHLLVKEYIHPDIFKKYEVMAKELGFKHAASSPYVRSSFNAEEFSNKYLQNE